MGNAKTEREKRRKKKRQMEKKGINWKYRESLENKLNGKIEICSRS